MSIQKLRSGRVPTATASTYVGEGGTIFWNASTGEFRLSDGVTPGGTRVGFPVASLTEIGGIKLGPGVTLNGDDQLVIDPAGLDFRFGDFYAFTNQGASDGACLSSVNTDQDINIVSNGNGTVNIIGEFNIHTTDSTVEGALSVRPVLSVSNAGYTKINVPQINIGSTGLLINGNSTEPFVTTVAGVTLRSVGNDGMSNTIAFDAHGTGAFASLTLRSSRGTGDTPTQTKSGDTVGRIAGVGFGTTTFSTEPSTGRAATDIRFVATEDFTDTRSGTKIDFYTSPNGGTVKTLSASIGPTGITANLTGNVTGNVSGNAGTVTNGVVTTGSYSDPSWLTISKSKVGLGNVENTALSTSTHYIGTTSIQYNRASAAQTLSGVSISGNAGTVTNGVYTTDTGTVTNTMLAGSIANNKLSNSTISGIALGSNLAALTIGTHLTGTSYNGSTGVTIATDATTDATASVLVARDSNGMVTAQNYKGNSRDAGTLTAGSTLTINFATDHIIYANITGAITISHQNIVAGRNVKVVLTNATGGNLAVTSGVADINTTGNAGTANLNANRMGVYEFISFGATTATLYCSVNK